MVGTPLVTAGWETSNDAVAGEESLTGVPGAERHKDSGRSSPSRQQPLRWGMPWMTEVCRCAVAAATGYVVYCKV